MQNPVIIEGLSFQEVWLKACTMLSGRSWGCYNLIAYINNPTLFNESIHNNVINYAKTNRILGPKDVAYTIFPFKQNKGSFLRFFNRYIHRFYPRIKTRWGTYFARMINYENNSGNINQLKNIIQKINKRKSVSKAAYTIIIQYPGMETTLKMGGPCLNYIAIQLAPGKPRKIGLLAVYRNHDFLERAYGNYWGLCLLLQFLAKKTHSKVGPITCISSHAYVDKHTKSLKLFINSL